MPVDPLFDSAACALAVTQEDGTILHVNPRLCDWLGFTAAQLLGRRFQDLLAMTPHAHRVPRDRRNALAELDTLTVTVDVAFRLLARDETQ